MKVDIIDIPLSIELKVYKPINREIKHWVITCLDEETNKYEFSCVIEFGRITRILLDNLTVNRVISEKSNNSKNPRNPRDFVNYEKGSIIDTGTKLFDLIYYATKSMEYNISEKNKNQIMKRCITDYNKLKYIPYFLEDGSNFDMDYLYELLNSDTSDLDAIFPQVQEKGSVVVLNDHNIYEEYYLSDKKVLFAMDLLEVLSNNCDFPILDKLKICENCNCLFEIKGNNTLKCPICRNIKSSPKRLEDEQLHNIRNYIVNNLGKKIERAEEKDSEKIKKGILKEESDETKELKETLKRFKEMFDYYRKKLLGLHIQYDKYYNEYGYIVENEDDLLKLLEIVMYELGITYPYELRRKNNVQNNQTSKQDGLDNKGNGCEEKEAIQGDGDDRVVR